MQHKNYKTSLFWFSIIEVMIGIFVFSLGLVSIFALLTSSLNINEYNKNAVIASNLAREQIELFRNIRDTNYKKLKKWDQINPSETYNSASTEIFEVDEYYMLENDFAPWASFPTQVVKISDHHEWKDALAEMEDYRLCIDSDDRYTYDCSGGNKKTWFYRYLYLETVVGESGPVSNAVRVVSKVVWYKRGYHEFDIKTVVTDWRRI